MSNNRVITSSMITDTTLAELHNLMGLSATINRQYEKDFGKEGAKAGNTINIRRPVQFQIRTGNVASIQQVNETTIPLVIGEPFGVDFEFDDTELALSIDQFSERYLKKAAKKIASYLDMNVSALINSVGNSVGTAGAFPTTQAGVATLFTDAGALLDDNAADSDDRYVLLNPRSNSKSVAAFTTMFNPNDSISKQYRSGQMGNALGFDFMKSQNIVTHTNGVWGGTPLINGAGQGTANTGATDNPWSSTTTLVTDGWTANTGAVAVGDRLTIAGVNGVNLENKQDLGYLRQFVVTAVATADGSGNMSITVSPGLVSGGAYQNVTALPANNAVITMLGTASASNAQNIAYHKDAFTLAIVDLPVIRGVDMSSVSQSDGISIRFVRDYDVLNNRRICRFDLLAGFVAQRPEWAVAVQG